MPSDKSPATSIPATVETLIQRVAEAVATAVTKDSDPMWLTIDETAARVREQFSISPRMAREIPVSKKFVAGRIRLNRDEVDAWAAQQVARAPKAGSCPEATKAASRRPRPRQNKAAPNAVGKTPGARTAAAE